MKFFVENGYVPEGGRSLFCEVLSFIFDLDEGRFFEDCDEDVEDEDTFSDVTITKIEIGDVLDIELAEFIKYAFEEMVSDIDEDITWRDRFGW